MTRSRQRSPTVRRSKLCKPAARPPTRRSRAVQIDAYTAWIGAPQVAACPIIADLPALGIVVLITALVYIGIRESKTASNIMVVVKLAVILLVIVVGAFFINTDNWTPFMPNGFGGVMTGVAAVFFAYIGFDALSTTAEECKDPYKTLPRGMIYSLIICTVLYVTLALVLTGMVSYTKLAVGDPLAFVFGPEGVNMPWMSRDHSGVGDHRHRNCACWCFSSASRVSGWR